MSNVRFITTQQNKGRRTTPASTFPKLINGNGAYAGAPALVQDPDFPMSNLLDPDRVSAVYVTGPTPANSGSDLIIEFDINSAPLSISAVGILGFVRLAGATFPNSVAIEYLPGSTYAPVVGWVAMGSFSMVIGRDGGLVTGSPISARFWRIRFLNASFGAQGFSFSSPFIANAITDLGFLYSRSAEVIVTPKTVVEGYGRTPVITRTGLEFRRWALAYDNNDVTTRDIFDALGASALPFIYLSPEDDVFECVQDGEEFIRNHIWSPGGRHQWVFPMRSLP
jgi:hypothetical protein